MYESGVDNGKFYSLNVPLKDGIDDQGGILIFWYFSLYLLEAVAEEAFVLLLDCVQCFIRRLVQTHAIVF